jgi:hypothetical protein
MRQGWQMTKIGEKQAAKNAKDREKYLRKGPGKKYNPIQVLNKMEKSSLRLD